MKEKMWERWRRHPSLLVTVIIVLASQISLGVVTVDFKISAAVVLLPVVLFLWPDFPVRTVTLLAAPGVFLLRALFQLASEGNLDHILASHGPEMIFYLVYGLLFSLYAPRADIRPFKSRACIPLVFIDMAANFCELFIRVGTDVFHPAVFFQLAAVGVGRALMAWAVLRVLDYYGFQVLRREENERYQRLLLMTAALKSEVAWMDKGTSLIEDTMNSAYHLYRQLRSAGADQETVDSALGIAKDIHEVKKEYFLIMRGIAEALEEDTSGDGMELRELMEVLGESVKRTARDQGKQVRYEWSCGDSFRTDQHHYLMSIFNNLLCNAVEAAGKDREVHISFTQRREGEMDVFAVQDDCGGIPESRRDQIFIPGFSSKINHATGEINRGLGLAIVRGLVEEKLHGTIEVESEGGGTVFTVTIPRANLEEEKDAVLSD